MKKLFLIRHAKSSWDDASLPDEERPLNKRGKKDAPLMGSLLRKQGITPDLIISSPAKRAFSTAKKMAKELAYPKDHILTFDKLYLSSPAALLEVIKSQPAEVRTLLVFGHNPELTQLVPLLCDHPIDSIPTSGVVSITFQTDTWQKIEKMNGRFDFFDYPKMHKEPL
ncbi:histidine phosphatase family protein [Rhodocytophaga aerolata]|uniref:Histidine phosphatase family protein n=1 Tax=Rhodocytophaga aerolata TaxID=455078 RepID=A0ABT8RAA9_9BACT|nr:histidine phosphatase family protein [Rhodocytophaga aerolata]MDO1448995.1 histidine phosphatase family protein [Rhodocytophaga aerolata]